MSLRRRMMMGLAGQPPKQDPLYTLNATAKGFFKRKTADGHNFNYPISYGNIRSLHGNTLVWNQMIEDGSVEKSASSATLGEGWSIPQTFPKGHVAYIRVTVKKSSDYAATNAKIVLVRGNNVAGHLIDANSIAADDKWYTLSNVVQAGSSYDGNYLRTYKYQPTAAGTFYAKDVILIDLTQMFGAGNEPTLAEFESLYPLGNYATDAGRLLDFKGETLVSKDTEENVLSTITIDPTTMQGYLNGEGEAVQIFPSGMMSAGSVFDEVYKEDGKWYAKVNVGSVEINPANVTWSQWRNNRVYLHTFTALNSADYCKAVSSVANRVSDRMTIQASGSMAALVEGAKGYVAINGNLIYITTADYNDRANLATFSINYELATSRTYLLTDEWQQILNTAYQVETGGMEIVLPENGSVPYTSPAKLSVDYNSVNNRRRSGLPYNPILNPYNGHAYVDLGLPSGTKWATMNVGANSEADYGLYFAWGETQGYADASTKAFSWNDYKFNPSGDGSTFTKYNETDGKTVLDLEDDAAHVNWGGDWHMPTKEQCEELFNTSYVTNAWVENYQNSGVNGRLFTSVSNGNTMFIPAAGYCEDGGVYSVSSIGYSWASALNSNLIFYAWNSFFDSHGTGVNINKRHNGQSVRGVVG